ncbi:MAG TPA: TraR/DksA C4-type zinc finger protein [Ornithinibacter sp.]|jgi:DnaK suppressor protein|nr:TraR/DksA C4-type zinc finger protein [Dermatophilaceae bacterium]MBU9943396.1 TraR/DksA C4-type zinc finger protein [Dermatophilaceae bacterium]HQW73387.1 TraR/DksA C4-type zinc finger protein [Ornithinibacter sp.]
MNTPVTFARPEVPPARADHLRGLEATLDEQFRSMPTLPADDVAAAHRASVERNLHEVRLALRMYAEGRYGTCIRCADPISVVRLEARPWSTRCIRCADLVGW